MDTVAQAQKKQAGILGMGRVGTFWAEFLSSSFEVSGYSRSRREHPAYRLASLEEVCSLPVVFICVPMRAVPETLEKIAPLLSPETLVADTCSVKVLPVKWMLEKLPSGTKILATHPMFGPESAKFGLDGLPVVLSPVRMPRADFQIWKDFFIQKKLVVREMTPEEHDMEAAKTQALTHMVGRTLSRLGVKDSPIGTLWYQKLVSICRQVDKDSPELFNDMQHLNPYAADVRKAFARIWEETSGELERDRPPESEWQPQA